MNKIRNNEISNRFNIYLAPVNISETSLILVHNSFIQSWKVWQWSKKGPNILITTPEIAFAYTKYIRFFCISSLATFQILLTESLVSLISNLLQISFHWSHSKLHFPLGRTVQWTRQNLMFKHWRDVSACRLYQVCLGYTLDFRNLFCFVHQIQSWLPNSILSIHVCGYLVTLTFGPQMFRMT